MNLISLISLADHWQTGHVHSGSFWQAHPALAHRVILLYLRNPSPCAMDRAMELLLPLGQSNTILSSCFPGKVTLNSCLNRCRSSFSLSSRMPTKRKKPANKKMQIHKKHLWKNYFFKKRGQTVTLKYFKIDQRKGCLLYMQMQGG